MVFLFAIYKILFYFYDVCVEFVSLSLQVQPTDLLLSEVDVSTSKTVSRDSVDMDTTRPVDSSHILNKMQDDAVVADTTRDEVVMDTCETTEDKTAVNTHHYHTRNKVNSRQIEDMPATREVNLSGHGVKMKTNCSQQETDLLTTISNSKPHQTINSEGVPLTSAEKPNILGHQSTSGTNSPTLTSDKDFNTNSTPKVSAEQSNFNIHSPPITPASFQATGQQPNLSARFAQPLYTPRYPLNYLQGSPLGYVRLPYGQVPGLGQVPVGLTGIPLTQRVQFPIRRPHYPASHLRTPYSHPLVHPGLRQGLRPGQLPLPMMMGVPLQVPLARRPTGIPKMTITELPDSPPPADIETTVDNSDASHTRSSDASNSMVDAASTMADVSSTAANVPSTAADTTSTTAIESSTAADVPSTVANVSSTAANVPSTVAEVTVLESSDCKSIATAGVSTVITVQSSNAIDVPMSSPSESKSATDFSEPLASGAISSGRICKPLINEHTSSLDVSKPLSDVSVPPAEAAENSPKCGYVANEELISQYTAKLTDMEEPHSEGATDIHVPDDSLTLGYTVNEALISEYTDTLSDAELSPSRSTGHVAVSDPSSDCGYRVNEALISQYTDSVDASELSSTRGYAVNEALISQYIDKVTEPQADDGGIKTSIDEAAFIDHKSTNQQSSGEVTVSTTPGSSPNTQPVNSTSRVNVLKCRSEASIPLPWYGQSTEASEPSAGQLGGCVSSRADDGAASSLVSASSSFPTGTDREASNTSSQTNRSPAPMLSHESMVLATHNPPEGSAPGTSKTSPVLSKEAGGESLGETLLGNEMSPLDCDSVSTYSDPGIPGVYHSLSTQDSPVVCDDINNKSLYSSMTDIKMEMCVDSSLVVDSREASLLDHSNNTELTMATGNKLTTNDTHVTGVDDETSQSPSIFVKDVQTTNTHTRTTDSTTTAASSHIRTSFSPSNIAGRSPVRNVHFPGRRVDGVPRGYPMTSRSQAVPIMVHRLAQPGIAMSRMQVPMRPVQVAARPVHVPLGRVAVNRPGLMGRPLQVPLSHVQLAQVSRPGIHMNRVSPVQMRASVVPHFPGTRSPSPVMRPGIAAGRLHVPITSVVHRQSLPRQSLPHQSLPHPSPHFQANRSASPVNPAQQNPAVQNMVRQALMNATAIQKAANHQQALIRQQAALLGHLQAPMQTPQSAALSQLQGRVLQAASMRPQLSLHQAQGLINRPQAASQLRFAVNQPRLQGIAAQSPLNRLGVPFVMANPRFQRPYR